MILHFYFARRFLKSFLGLMLVFTLLIMLFDLIEQIRRLSDTTAGFSQALGLTMLHVPETLYEMIPLIVVLATVAMFVGLARSSELVVTRAAGRAALVSLMSPVLVAFGIGVFALALLNPIVAVTLKRYSAMTEFYLSGSNAALSFSSEGLWLRQGDDDGQTVIHAGRANAEGTQFYGVTFYGYAPQGGLTSRTEAESAELLDGEWLLTDVKRWPLDAGGNPEALAETAPTVRVPSSLTVDNIRDSFGEPSAISIWDLPAYTAALKEAGFSARRYLVWIQTELARPFFLMAMVLIAAAFTMRHARSGKVGLAVLTSILMGFSLYYVKNFAQILGDNGQIPIWVAAWAPPVAALMLSVGLVLQMEDG
ncbi:LPS export ABC transporter permease LptG [Pseudooceanicola nanhaiensis]|jgi:lipopolysaccharide export system permease protein|uniref:LPS export ABC transporter permease LptG n=1 Tax=Pseudooceanicola nanhaiensis TaxID=375761 RepID=A0A917SPE4_9RHOB|nr:LPS export ABC transporter permease LptG [Pseudooceanicola nanhaiensis]GGL89961.1 LPS export ABC transporter permease LptG [Pseudooceanicola nanhaiensis]